MYQETVTREKVIANTFSGDDLRTATAPTRGIRVLHAIFTAAGLPSRFFALIVPLLAVGKGKKAFSIPDKDLAQHFRAEKGAFLHTRVRSIRDLRKDLVAALARRDVAPIMTVTPGRMVINGAERIFIDSHYDFSALFELRDELLSVVGPTATDAQLRSAAYRLLKRRFPKRQNSKIEKPKTRLPETSIRHACTALTRAKLKLNGSTVARFLDELDQVSPALSADIRREATARACVDPADRLTAARELVMLAAQDLADTIDRDTLTGAAIVETFSAVDDGIAKLGELLRYLSEGGSYVTQHAEQAPPAVGLDPSRNADSGPQEAAENDPIFESPQVVYTLAVKPVSLVRKIRTRRNAANISEHSTSGDLKIEANFDSETLQFATGADADELSYEASDAANWAGDETVETAENSAPDELLTDETPVETAPELTSGGDLADVLELPAIVPAERAALETVTAFTSVGARVLFVRAASADDRTRGARHLKASAALSDLPRMVAEATAAQFNIMVRPVETPDWSGAVQLDDLDGRRAARLAAFAFLVLRTSPNSYHAWLHVSDAPQPTPEATAARREWLAAKLDDSKLRELPTGKDRLEDLESKWYVGRSDWLALRRRIVGAAQGDKAASGSSRVPGSLNVKAKYAPDFPTVEIVALTPGRSVTIAELDAAGLIAPEPPRPAPALAIVREYNGRQKWPSYQIAVDQAPRKPNGEPDLSSADLSFLNICRARGFTEAETEARWIEERSAYDDKARRNPGYARRTVALAFG